MHGIHRNGSGQTPDEIEQTGNTDKQEREYKRVCARIRAQDVIMEAKGDTKASATMGQIDKPAIIQ